MHLSQELFALIRSLDSETKKRLRKQAGGKEKRPRYLVVFDVLDSLPEFDEKLFRARLNRETSIRNLADTKKYLLRYILEVLESQEDHPRKQIRSLINRYELLYARDFRQLARAQLEEAEKIARSNDFSIQLAEIQVLRMHVTGEMLLPDAAGQSVAQLAALHSDINRLTDAISLVESLRFEHGLLRINSKGIMLARTEAERLEYAALADRYARFGETPLDSFAWQFYYCQLLSASNFIAMRMDKAHEALDRFCKWISQKPGFIPVRLSTIMTIYYNKSIVELMLCRHSICETIAEAERLCKEAGKPEQQQLFFLPKLQYAWETNNYEETWRLIRYWHRTAQNGKMGIKLKRAEIVCRFLEIHLFLVQNDLKNARKAYYRALKTEIITEYQNYETFLKLLGLLIEFEEGDYRGFESQVMASYKYLGRKKRLYRVEKLILQFLGKAIRKRFDKSEFMDLLSGFRNQLRELQPDAGETLTIRLTGIQEYLNSKINGISLAAARAETFAERWK